MRRLALTLLLGCLLLVGGASADPGDPWWNSSWEKRVPLTVTDASSTDGVQVLYNITYDSDMQSDFDDLRFVQDDGSTTIDYWIETKSDSNYAVCWLELPASETLIYQYYGNPDTEGGGNGTAVFKIFDDFDGSSGESPSSAIWTTQKFGSSNAVIELDGSGHLKLQGYSTTISSASVLSVSTFTRGVSIEYREKITGTYQYSVTSFGSGSLQGWDGSSDYWYTRLASGYTAMEKDIREVPASGSPTVLVEGSGYYPPDLDTYYRHSFEWKPNNQINHIVDSVTIASGSDSTYASGTMKLALSQGRYSNGNGGTRYIDWVAVRTRVATEPTVSSGYEETGSFSPTAAFTANTTTGFAPLAVQFTDNSSATPTSWSWNFGDGNTSTAQNPAHTYTAAGTYSVNLTATNELGSDYELKTDYITVYGPITAAFTANVTTGLAPLTVAFTDTSTGSPTTWAWDIDNSGSTDYTTQNPVHTYDSAGTYTVKLTASHTYSSDDETKAGYITVVVLQPFPGCSSNPTDLDADGIYEDINGNTRWDFQDIVLYFENLAWCEANQPIALFDWNINGRCDFNDVYELWSEGGMI